MLQMLRQSCHWDAVIAVTIHPPSESAAAATEAAAARTEGDTNGYSASGASSDDSSRVSHPSLSNVEQDQSDANAESMLILGLRGQRHDLER